MLSDSVGTLLVGIGSGRLISRSSFVARRMIAKQVWREREREREREKGEGGDGQRG